MRKLLSLIVMLVMSVAMLIAQNRTVTGTVISAEDGEPVIGASVIVVGTNLGTVTDIDGKFSLSVPQSAKTLRFSYVGMEPKDAPIKDKMSIQLGADDKILEDVVVTAMGVKRDRKALGYAVQDVKGEALVQAASTDVSSSLQGKVTGVQITSASGMPGASSRITIRGSRSLSQSGDNTPLYVVDGQPIASAADVSTGSSVTGSDMANRSLDIDPNDIESINILKGQAASALYGMRASNGVILITTKSGKGKTGKPQISYNTNLSFDRLAVTPKVQKEYSQGSGGNFAHNSSLAWGPKIADLPNDAKYGGNTDNSYTKASGMHQGMYYVPQLADAGLDPWVKPQTYDNIGDFFETGVTWTNHLSVGQSNDKGHMNFSLGNTHTDGIFPGTSMDRYNVHLAGATALSKQFELGYSANYVTSKINKQTGANDSAVNAVYNAPSSYNLKGIPSHKANDPYSQTNFRSLTFDNPYWAATNNTHMEKSQRFYGNAYLKYSTDFGTDHKHQLDIKYQLGNDSYTSHYNETWGYGHKGGTGEIELFHYTINELNSLATVNYMWKVNEDLNIGAMYGNEVVYRSRRYEDEYGAGFAMSGWNHMDNATTFSATEGTSKRLTVGNFINISADWKNMLFLNITGRADKVSSMPRGNRSFFYPSYSLGFIFTEIEALKNNVLTYGKIRASYAEVGEAGNYVDTYYTTPGFGGGFSSQTPVMYPFNGVNAYVPSTTYYDPNLKPQNTKSYEAGVDLGFFNGRIKVEYTYSRQNVKDQIFSVPMASTSGFSSKVTNAGKVHTDAHELTVGFIPVQTKDWEWTLDFNYSKIDNVVDELADGVESIFLGGFTEPQVRASAGDKFPVIYGTSFLRNEDGTYALDKNGLPQAADEKVIGAVSPDFQLGVSTSLTWKKLRLAAVLDWRQGGYMYAGTATMMDYYGVSQKSSDFRSADKFVNEFGGNELPGSMAYNYFNRLSNISEAFIKESSYLKLRELTLSYPVVDKRWMKLNLNLFARNILLWTPIEGFDPEVSQGNNNMAGGFERFSLPSTSTYGFGLTFNF